MTIGEILKSGGLSTSESEILLASLLAKDRSWIIAHPEYVLTSEELTQWKDWSERRKNHEPVAYIAGQKEFYGRMFSVNPSVLIPRPSTEGLVEMVLELLRNDDINHQESVRTLDSEIVAWMRLKERRTSTELSVTSIVDVGTGSGCIAVTLALERPDLQIIATDISEDALNVARKNAERLGAKNIRFLSGDLLDPVQDLAEPFLVVSNPPYVPSGETLMQDVKDFEPHGALFAGEDGADIVRRLVAQCWEHPQCSGFIIECREDQMEALRRLSDFSPRKRT